MSGENAVGFTCYMDTILRASSFELNPKRIIVYFQTNDKKIKELIRKGFIIERYFGLKKQLISEAKRKKYNYVLIGNSIKRIKNV